MVNIAPGHSTANHMTTHMLAMMMHFSPVAGPTPHTTARVLDVVLSHNQVRYQDKHIPHHLHPWDRMALIPVHEGFRSQHLTLMVLRCRRVHLMVL